MTCIRYALNSRIWPYHSSSISQCFSVSSDSVLSLLITDAHRSDECIKTSIVCKCNHLNRHYRNFRLTAMFKKTRTIDYRRCQTSTGKVTDQPNKIISFLVGGCQVTVPYEMVGFRCGLLELFRLLGSYAAYVGYSPTFRDNLSFVILIYVVLWRLWRGDEAYCVAAFSSGCRKHDCLVGIANRYGLDGPGIELRLGPIF